MTWHFIKTDFKSTKLYWILLFIATAIFVPFVLRFEEGLFLLGSMYFIFSMVPSTMIVGSRFRNQHSMSRNYLLSLPLNRKKLFQILLSRMFVFQTPLILLLLIVPILDEKIIKFAVAKNIYFSAYSLIILFGNIALPIFSVAMTLHWEKTTSYLTQRQRLIAGILGFGAGLLEFVFVTFGTFYIFFGIHQFVAVLFLAFCVSFRFHFTRKTWMTAG